MSNQSIELIEDEYKAPNKDTTPIGMYCRDRMTEWDNSSYRQNKNDEIKSGRERYRNKRKEKNFPWKNSSNKSMGLEAIAIDKLEPRLKNRLVGESDFIQVDPVGPADVEKAPKCKDFLEWAAKNNMKIDQGIRPILHDLLLDGTKDVLEIWDEKKVMVRTRAEMPVFRNQAGERVEVPPSLTQGTDPAQLIQQLIAVGIYPDGSEDGYREREENDWKVKVEPLNLADCFFPDYGGDWNEQPFFRYIYPTLRELKESMDSGGPYKNITEDMVDSGRRQTTDDEADKGVDYSLYEQKCQLLECYLQWKGEWVIATFSPDAGWKEVRNQKLIDVYWHGHKPVRRFRIYPESNESMGTGIPTKIVHFSKGINDLFNQMIDNATIETMPYYFYNKSATGMESVNKKLFPGRGVPIPKDSQVYFPQSGVKSPVFIEFINLLLSFFERTLSIMDYSAGTRSATTGQGGDTASGMNMILQEGNIAHNYTGEQLQDVFADLLTDALSLYAQYLPMDAQRRISEDGGWTFEDVDVQSIQGRFDLTVSVSDASANTMTNRNETLTLSQVTAGSPVVNQVENMKDLYKAFGHKDADKYISPAFNIAMQAVSADPQGVTQVIQQHMQEFMQQQEEQKIRGQAEDNITRQAIEREVEAPHENNKMVDQANESFKRGKAKEMIEMMGGLPQ